MPDDSSFHVGDEEKVNWHTGCSPPETVCHTVADGPRDIAGLQRLAESFTQAGRHVDADRVLAEALTLAPDSRDIQLALYRCARFRRDPAAALSYLTLLLARFPDERALQLDRAETLLDLNRVGPAEHVCRAVLDDEPNNRRAHIAMVQAARIRRDEHLLLQRLDAAFAAMEPDAEMLIERGELHLSHGDRQAAEADFAVALALAPADRRARLGLFHASRGRVSPQIEYDRISAVIEVSPPEPALRLDLAEALIRLDRADAAETEALGVLAEQPADTRALQIMVQAAQLRRDAPLLLQRIAQARAAAPEQPEFGRDLDWDRAAALITLGRTAEVLPLLDELAKNAADDDDSLLRLGRLSRAMGNRRAALAYFQRALNRQPDHPEALFDACTELTALGAFVAAEQLAQHLARLDGQAMVAALCQGFIERERGDRAAALTAFQQARNLAPDHPGAALNAAAELAELGDYAAATALVGPILETARGTDIATTIDALMRLAHIAQLQPDRPTALARLQEAAGLASNNSDIFMALAAEYREQGRFNEAGAALDRVEVLRPRSLATLLARGHLARRRGQRQEALQWYTAAHAAFPDAADPLAEMAIEQRALNQPQQADFSLRRALICEPGHIGATLCLAEHHLIAERYAACIATCQELRARLPYMVVAWLLECRAVAARDGISAALALLDAADERLGVHPNLLARRIDLLRDAGDYPAIRAMIDLAEPHARHQGLWASMVRALLRFAEISEIEAWLARAPTGDIGAIAEAEELRGAFAEVQWRPAAALAHYRNAVRIDPNRYPLEQDIARLCLVECEVEQALTALRRYMHFAAGERRLRGESGRPSQTHVGQLLDEYRLDTETLGTLRELKAASATSRVTGAQNLIAKAPGSTAAASFLLISLRAAGLFDQMRPVGPARPMKHRCAIPRRIAQYWFQADTPPDIAALMQTWRDHHCGWEYVRFDDATAQTWLRRHALPGVLTAYLRAMQKAQKADLFRLAWLSIEGGIYADADDRCLAPFDTCIPPYSNFVAYQEDYGTLGNNILACTQSHPVIRHALKLAVAAVLNGDNDLLWLSTGPGLLSRAFAHVLPPQASSRKSFLANMTILDRRTIGRVMAMHCLATYKATENHWLQNLVK